jgi:hypothetical protein
VELSGNQRSPFYNGVEVSVVAPLWYNDVCGQQSLGLASVAFFFLHFSLLLIFHDWPFKISRQPFNCFLLQIYSIFFWLLFILYEIIYQTIIFFSISSYFNSSCIRSVSILFIAIFLFEILFARKNYSKHHIVYSIYYMPSLFWKLYKTSFINKIFQINQKNPIYIRKPKNLILLSFHLTFLVSH